MSDKKEWLGIDRPLFTIGEQPRLEPILSKPKIIPIRSSLARQLEEREDKLLAAERKGTSIQEPSNQE